MKRFIRKSLYAALASSFLLASSAYCMDPDPNPLEILSLQAFPHEIKYYIVALAVRSMLEDCCYVPEKSLSLQRPTSTAQMSSDGKTILIVPSVQKLLCFSAIMRRSDIPYSFMPTQVLDSNTLQPIFSLDGSHKIEGAHLSGDGKSVLTFSEPSKFTLREIPTNRILKEITLPVPISLFLGWNSENKIIFTLDTNEKLALWNITTQEQLLEFKTPLPTRLLPPVLIFNGKTIFKGCQNEEAFLWDAQTGKQLLHFTDTQIIQVAPGISINFPLTINLITSAQFSPDDKMILIGSKEHAYLCDTQTGKVLHKLKGHTKRVYSVAFSPDGARALTGSEDGTIRLWDLKTGLCLKELKGHSTSVDSVGFGVDGKRLITRSRDGKVVLWGRSSALSLDFTNEFTTQYLKKLYPLIKKDPEGV